MSDYPPTPSYGANYGSQDQAIPPYLPPTYPNQYMQPENGRPGQGHMASNYDASMSAYAYNRAMPAFSAAAVASGVPPLPLYQGWNQDPIPLPSFNPPQNPIQYSPPNNNPQFGSQFYSSYGHPSYHSSAQAAKPYEQGELSEGEFEDSGLATNTPPVPYAGSHYANDTNYGDSSASAGYSGARDLNAQKSYSANTPQYPRNQSAQLRRQQSGSYSPYVPAAADHDEYYNDTRHNPSGSKLGVPHEVSAPPQKAGKGLENAADFPVQKAAQSNGYYDIQGGSKAVQAKASKITSTSDVPSIGNGKTVAESRKKAEAAILNLLPYNVRYQTYIDEGFREDIVGPLFDGLKMPRNSADPTNAAWSQPPPDAKAQKENGVTTEQHSQVSSDVRKAASETAATSEPQVQQTQPSAPVPKSAAMTEKERTLQSKMDALRKSREERTKKQAAAKDAKPAAKPSPLPAAKPSPVHTAAAAPPPVTKVPEVNVPAKPTASPLTSISQSRPQITNNPAPSQSRPPAIVPQLRQQPSIPGLFLASSGIPGLQSSGPSTPNSSTPSAQRKRPVAADFDDPIPAMTTFKRPFGQHRNDRPLVINVSDDEGESEDEDVAMDLDSTGDPNSPVQPEGKMSGHRPAVPANSTQAAKQVNKPFTPPQFPSASNTPPLPPNFSQTLRSSPQDLELSIKELKRRIAEKEAKKRAKQTPSRALSPRPSEGSSELKSASNTNGDVSGKIDSTAQIQQRVTVAQKQVDADQQKLVDAQAAEAEKATEVSRNESEQKRLRREKNAAEKSAVDAEVLQSRSKLEELRAAMAEIEAAYSKSLEKKQKLEEEAEQIEQAELQAEKDRLALTASQTPPSATDHPVSPLKVNAAAAKSLPATNENPTLPAEVNDETPPNTNFQDPPVQVDRAPLTNGLHPPTTAENVNDREVMEVLIESPPTNQALEAALQEAVRAEADLHTTDKEDGEVDIDLDVEMGMEDSYAPDPNYLAPESVSGVPNEKDSSSDYSPVLHRTAPPSVPDGKEGSPSYSPVLHRNCPETQERDDEYEPPEATEPVEATVLDSPPFSPAPPDVVPETALEEPMDISPASPIRIESVLEHKADEHDVNSTQDNSEHRYNGSGELLPSVIGSSPKLVEPGFEDVSKTPKYTPYESPLKRFRAYRFHPEFNQDVSGGLRSKTYSHRIDPNKEFCRYELTGGVCNDSTCDLQHFKDIVLPDDAVLTALGSPEEFKGEQRDKFCEGLKGVLMGLRVRKIRDFDIIASEIVAHRAKFLGDKSKVLALEGTTI